MRVASATVVVKGFHASDPDGDFGETLTPGASEAVADDDRDRDLQMFPDFTMEAGGRAVRVLGEKKGVLATVDVGDIDPAIGADETVAGLGYQDPVFATDDGLAFADRQFGDARVDLVTTCPGTGLRGGPNRVKSDQPALGLETILCFTTRMSPSASDRRFLLRDSRSLSMRTSPALISPATGMGMTRSSVLPISYSFAARG